jgi:hypothetical protein
VPVGEGEVEAVAAAGAELLASPERLRGMGEAARDFVRRRHDPARSARAMVDAFAELARLDPPVARSVEVPPPTSLTWARLEGELEVRGLEPSWSEGERRRLELRLTNRGPARWLAAGPGRVTLEVSLLDADGEPVEGGSSLPLPADLASGESTALAVELRRPLGPSLLRIESRIPGGAQTPRGGVRWERAI